MARQDSVQHDEMDGIAALTLDIKSLKGANTSTGVCCGSGVSETVSDSQCPSSVEHCSPFLCFRLHMSTPHTLYQLASLLQT